MVRPVGPNLAHQLDRFDEGRSVHDALRQVLQSKGLLVVGSSLTVWSRFQFVKAAKESGLPVAAVNPGQTRADDLLDFKPSARCGDVPSSVAEQLITSSPIKTQ